jgi:leucyl aminopeptidase
VHVSLADTAPADSGAGLLCLGLFEGEGLPAPFDSAPGAADARGGFRKRALLHPERPARVLVVGLGKREEFEPERARVAAALAVQEANRLELGDIAWAVPRTDSDADSDPDPDSAKATAAALAEGTVLATYRFDRYRHGDDVPSTRVESLELLGAGEDAAMWVKAAHIGSEAANRARELQDLPGNELTPTRLAEHAEGIAASHDSVSIEVLGRDEMEERGMGGLLAVSRGSAEEPRLIVLRYAGGGTGGTLGLVGKAVTFDTGGISIKPAGKMHEMKMDMSGGAAVLEAVGAIATIGLPVEILAVVPSVENMPSGTAVKPGDVVTHHNGKTVEVINTDAEGRLILADALSYAAEQGAERIVDLATLTGAVVTALGSTYAGLISNDDALAEQVAAAGEHVGELAWRLPLHDEYKQLTKGTITDLVNASDKRKAATIYAASFLEEFVDGRPWAHLDIAGTAWDTGREYVGAGPTGFGTRLLVYLASRFATR